MSWENVLKKPLNMHPIVLEALEVEFQKGDTLTSSDLITIANNAISDENIRREQGLSKWSNRKKLSQRNVPERGKIFQWARTHPNIIKVRDSGHGSSQFQWQGA